MDWVSCGDMVGTALVSSEETGERVDPGAEESGSGNAMTASCRRF